MIKNPDSLTTIHIDDSGDHDQHDVTVTNSAVTGLSLGAIRYEQSTVASLNIDAGRVDPVPSGNTFHVLSTPSLGFLGGLTTHEVLLRHVAQFREDVDARLVGYRAIDRTNSNRGHDWYHRHLLVLGVEHAERELAWVDRVEAALRRGPR